ncbi:hypothetical protein D8M04_15150 [Oceanobacillus piezotolerans]|uniref:Uncharacterized protein n=1 Tax=Oceanobacillus piezotolerans TaxID=2448030 RepID=A0A498D8L3_9BACI|nr:hypothetical protein [Oceanobacillus piezotolerans]RLL42883.1 hypothetical protein D8M04_15150 [Oceanobacillus piezotolerans]
MRILKAKNTIRYYYEDHHLYLVGEKKTNKIRAGEADYLEIHYMISQLRNGLGENAAYELFPRFKALLEFLIDRGLVYQIDKEILQHHSKYEYFSWLEGNSLITEYNLNRIGNFSIVCPKQHIASSALIDKCLENDIDHRLDEEATCFELWEGNACISSFIIYQNEKEEIVIAPPENNLLALELDNSMVAGKILAPFIFHALLTSAFDEYPSVFFIKRDLEVKKRRKFYLKKTEDNGRTVSKLEADDTITSLNALEKFLQLYHSSVSSFNLNRDYHEYQQLPIQILTIQKQKGIDSKDNYYIADVSYERLAKFVVEVVFMEALLSDHPNDITILQDSKVIHRLNAKEKEREQKILYVNIKNIPEYEMIDDLLTKDGMELSFLVDIHEQQGLMLYLHEKGQDKWYKYNYTIYNKEYIPLIIYTWISAKLNHVPLLEAGFSQVSMKQENIAGLISYEDIFLNVRSEVEQMSHLNISNILKELGYGYEVMEGS